MLTVALGFVLFTGIIFVLVTALLLARRFLVERGPVTIDINGDPSRALQVEAGRTLLETLATGGVLVPSACGGKGTCGACQVQVVSGGGPALGAEVGLLGRGAARRGIRLACQLKVRRDLEVLLPDEIMNVGRWRCRVRSTRNVATFIKELVLDLPAGETLHMRAGGFVQVECPPYELSYADLDVGEAYRGEWDRHGLRRLSVRNDAITERAYSMANPPGEDAITLNVRVALPPLDAPESPPGVVSSYLFGLRRGDEVVVSGPYGHFHARDTDSEMCFIGGGAGMAPLRSHIVDQLQRRHTKRRISYWYGARSLSEAFYIDEFESLAAHYANFKWHLALSAPLPEDDWHGATGFIHQVLFEAYLERHPCPEDVEYYLCGPAAMLEASLKMLDDLGVAQENILFDDFGG